MAPEGAAGLGISGSGDSSRFTRGTPRSSSPASRTSDRAGAGPAEANLRIDRLDRIFGQAGVGDDPEAPVHRDHTFACRLSRRGQLLAHLEEATQAGDLGSAPGPDPGS